MIKVVKRLDHQIVWYGNNDGSNMLTKDQIIEKKIKN